MAAGELLEHRRLPLVAGAVVVEVQPGLEVVAVAGGRLGPGAGQVEAVHATPDVSLGGLAAVAAAGAIGVQQWFPMLLLGGPWVVAAVILCGGALLMPAEPPAPSA